MPDNTMSADDVHAQVHALRAQMATIPEKIELGRLQRQAIETAQRLAAGIEDIGALLEFQGMQIVKSRRDDHVRLLGTGDQGEDVELEPVVPDAPSGPDAPVEAQPSGG